MKTRQDQPGLRQRESLNGILVGDSISCRLLGFIEDPVRQLLAAGGKALALRQAELLLEQLNAFVQYRHLRLKGADIVLNGAGSWEMSYIVMSATIANSGHVWVYVNL